MKKFLATSSLACLVASGCGPAPEQGAEIPELDEALTAIATPCTFAPLTGTAAVTLASAELAVVSRRALDSAILVNGVACGTATATTMKRLNVTGAGGAETLILDYQNGLFGAGTAASAGIVVDMGAGTDAFKIRGQRGADTFTFGPNGVNIAADTIRDITVAGAEEFVVASGDANDIVSAAGGAGTGATAFASAITVFGGAGNDTITGGLAADELNGGAGNDILRGGDGDDALNGGDDNDTFEEGAADSGSDVFDGGAGTDTVSYASRLLAVTADIEATGADTDDDGESGEEDEVLDTIEGITGGAEDDDLTCGATACTLIGGAGDDVLTGGAGNDTISGGLGDDTINGDAGDDSFDMGAADDGSDVLNGGAGTDVVDYSGRSGDLTVTMDGATANDGEDDEGDDVNADVEDILAGGGADTITGNNAANVITGGAGDDVLSGGAGDDTFAEGAADSGSDVFNGGTGTDTVDYSERVAALTVTMDGVDADDGLSGEGDDVNADVENCFGGGEADTITGNALDNNLRGGAEDDVISGGAGNDQLEGGLGDDDLDGGAGDDVLDGEAGTDTLEGGDGDGDICFETGTNCEL